MRCRQSGEKLKRTREKIRRKKLKITPQTKGWEKRLSKLKSGINNVVQQVKKI